MINFYEGSALTFRTALPTFYQVGQSFQDSWRFAKITGYLYGRYFLEGATLKQSLIKASELLDEGVTRLADVRRNISPHHQTLAPALVTQAGAEQRFLRQMQTAPGDPLGGSIVYCLSADNTGDPGQDDSRPSSRYLMKYQSPLGFHARTTTLLVKMAGDPELAGTRLGLTYGPDQMIWLDFSKTPGELILDVMSVVHLIYQYVKDNDDFLELTITGPTAQKVEQVGRKIVASLHKMEIEEITDHLVKEKQELRSELENVVGGKPKLDDFIPLPAYAKGVDIGRIVYLDNPGPRRELEQILSQADRSATDPELEQAILEKALDKVRQGLLDEKRDLSDEPSRQLIDNILVLFCESNDGQFDKLNDKIDLLTGHKDLDVLARVSAWAEKYEGHSRKFTEQIDDFLSRLLPFLLGAKGYQVKSVRQRLLDKIGQKRIGEERFILLTETLQYNDLAKIRDLVSSVLVADTDEGTHLAIKARDFGICLLAYGQEPGWTNEGKEGQTMVIWADEEFSGYQLAPKKETVSIFNRHVEGQELSRLQAVRLAILRPITEDGQMVHQLVNLDSLEQVHQLATFGFEAIGLVRSEGESKGKTINEALDNLGKFYSAIVRKFSCPITIRLFDLSPDKGEDWAKGADKRGLNFLLHDSRGQEFLRQQLRLILKQSERHHQIKILVPLVHDQAEFNEFYEVLDEVKGQLRFEGQNFNEDIEIGVMVETKAIVQPDVYQQFLADPRVSFFSLGTNDLFAELLGTDRFSAKDKKPGLKPLRQQEILRTLAWLVDQANQAGKPISLCGDSASEPESVPLLLAAGLRWLSCRPGNLAQVRQMLRATDISVWASLLADLIGAKTMSSEEIEKLVREKLAETQLNLEATLVTEERAAQRAWNRRERVLQHSLIQQNQYRRQLIVQKRLGRLQELAQEIIEAHREIGEKQDLTSALKLLDILSQAAQKFLPGKKVGLPSPTDLVQWRVAEIIAFVDELFLGSLTACSRSTQYVCARQGDKFYVRAIGHRPHIVDNSRHYLKVLPDADGQPVEIEFNKYRGAGPRPYSKYSVKIQKDDQDYYFEDPSDGRHINIILRQEKEGWVAYREVEGEMTLIARRFFGQLGRKRGEYEIPLWAQDEQKVEKILAVYLRRDRLPLPLQIDFDRDKLDMTYGQDEQKVLDNLYVILEEEVEGDPEVIRFAMLDNWTDQHPDRPKFLDYRLETLKELSEIISQMKEQLAFLKTYR